MNYKVYSGLPEPIATTIERTTMSDVNEQAADDKPKAKKAAAKKAAPAKKAPAKKVAAKKAPAKKEAKPKAEKVAKEPVDRSTSISNSWHNPDTAAARNLKSKVKVAGVEYRSVLQAFQELKLPISKHIAFRALLKASGKEVFKDEATGAKHTFILVPPAAE